MTGFAIIVYTLMAAASGNLHNLSLTQRLNIPGAFAMGTVESVSTTTSTFPYDGRKKLARLVD